MVFSCTYVQAQTFKYQAVLRDNGGAVLTNKNVALKVSIMQGATPTSVYSEEFIKATDEFGIINLEIGKGTVLSGNYLVIDWSKENSQLEVEIDINGGRNYALLGTSPILSVPVANYAAKAGVAGSASTAEFASSAGSASTAEFAISADSAGFASSAGSAEFAASAGSAGFAASAGSAGFAASAGSAGFPAGMVIAFAGDTSNVPVGWILCNGKAVSRINYASLFQTIGISWGAGDNVGTFNLPDLRGQFLRGADLKSGVDPDAESRTANGNGVKNAQGSRQNDAFQAHNHDVYAVQSGGAQSGNNDARFSLEAQHSPTLDILSKYGYGTVRFSSETRPKNVYVNYIIKY
jgi:microcystin-dependent protein